MMTNHPKPRSKYGIRLLLAGALIALLGAMSSCSDGTPSADGGAKPSSRKATAADVHAKAVEGAMLMEELQGMMIHLQGPDPSVRRFRAEMGQIDTAWMTAEFAKGIEDWSKASQDYDRVIEQCNQLSANIKKWMSVSMSRANIQSVRYRVSGFKAPQWAPREWEKAEAVAREGESLYGKHQFDEAMAKWKEAEALYEACEPIAKEMEARAKGVTEVHASARKGKVVAVEVNASKWAAAEWTQAEVLNKEAEELFQKHQFEESQDKWREALEFYNSSARIARKIIEEEKNAVFARAASDKEKQDASEVEASKRATVDWDMANGLSVEATESFRKNEFVQAAEKWGQARKKYRSAAEHSKRVIAWEESAKRWDLLVSEVDEKLLAAHTPDEWKNIQETASRGKASVENPVAGKEFYDTAMIALQQTWVKARRLAAGEGTPRTLNIGTKAVSMVWIKPGKLIMGTNARDSMSNERPQTEVTLTSGYWMSATLVTQAQWVALVDPAQMQRLESSREPGLGPDLPVFDISWENAMTFCQMLNERERAAGRLPAGYVYTLPSEAEWEYAARAGSSTQWWFGNDESKLKDYAWFDENSGRRPQPVAKKPANPWGLYDVHGNVWEWTRGSIADYPGGSVTNYEVPARSSRMAVCRGGGFFNSSGELRSGYRRTGANLGQRGIGLRLVLKAEF